MKKFKEWLILKEQSERLKLSKIRAEKNLITFPGPSRPNMMNKK